MNKKDWLAVAIFAALIAAFFLILGGLNRTTDSEQTLLVRDAVIRAARSCYATEGFYPGDPAYLEEHYGLLYDKENYVVFYDAFASNLMPTVRVVRKGDVSP